MAPKLTFWTVTGQSGPVIATAVHDGHAVRPEVARWILLDETARLREEDPFTASWTSIADIRIVAGHSRFELDLNRPRDRAVYRSPDDAWGLAVWRRDVPSEIFERSLAIYDEFYQQLHELLASLIRQFGHVVVLDLHSYNHRRPTPASVADPRQNPDINVGTSNMDRAQWQRLVDRFLQDVSRNQVGGRSIDVRENVRFQGGHLVRWIHDRFPDSACALAIEVKKVFMDEWSGTPDPAAIGDIGRALASAVAGLREELASH